MASTRSVTKHDLEILSNLVFDSYTSQEVEFQSLHFVFRTLTSEEREDISRRYKYLSNKYNIHLVLEILSNSILFINGWKFIKSEHKHLLNKLSSRLVLKLYETYQKIDNESIEASRFIDYYVETRESRNMWAVFKTCSRITEPFAIRKLNQYQFYWIVMNSFKDSFEDEKRTWAKVEYMTNSICAFVNPKAFRRSKGQMGVVEQLEQHEDKTKQQVVEQLETGDVSKEVYQGSDVFSSMERQASESEEQHENRVNVLMERTLKGELTDEHDRIVRQSELEFFKKFLREKRIQVLVEKELYKRQGMRFDSVEVLENDSLKKQFEEDKKKGFYYEDFSYLEIVRMKDFAAVPKKEKIEAFEEVMCEPIDVEKEVEYFLKSLSKQSSDGENIEKEDGLETQVNEQEHVTMVQTESESRMTESDSSEGVDVIRTAAERAAKMNVNVKGVDLMQQRQDKIKRVENAMEQRRQAFDGPDDDKPDDDLDVMRFDIK
jgi:hypothetical protein